MGQSDSGLIAATMTPEAAEKFKLALLWATSAASVRADEYRDQGQTERAEMFDEHAEWLRWGLSRVMYGESQTP